MKKHQVKPGTILNCLIPDQWINDLMAKKILGEEFTTIPPKRHRGRKRARSIRIEDSIFKHDQVLRLKDHCLVWVTAMSKCSQSYMELVASRMKLMFYCALPEYRNEQCCYLRIFPVLKG